MERSGIIEFEQKDDIGYLTIDNPPKNRIPDPVIAEPEYLNRWLHSEGLKAAIITGRGNSFSEGGDLQVMESMKDDYDYMVKRLDEGKKVLNLLKQSPIPIIAAIKGACLGGGLEVALACHVRVAAATSMFGFPEAELGFLPGLGGTVSCVEEIGIHYALPFLLSAEMVTAEKALEIGLIHYVIPKKEVFKKAESIVFSLITNKKTAVINRVMKAVILGKLGDRKTALHEESRYFAELASLTKENTN